MAKSKQISNSSSSKEGVETKKVRATIQSKDYKLLKESELEITEQLLESVARHKSYYMLSNAHQRTMNRPDYEGVEYHLSAYKDGYDYLKKHHKDLHVKLLNIIKTYIENDFNSDLAPSIHRLEQHYKWDSIDILTVKEHRQLDNAIETAMLAVDENGGLYFDRFDSKSDAKTELNLNENQLNKLLEGEVATLENVAPLDLFGAKYTIIGPFDNEEQRKEFFESKGITYEPPAIREERAARMLKQVKSEKLDTSKVKR